VKKSVVKKEKKSPKPIEKKSVVKKEKKSSGCTQQKAKKYMDRPSPSFPANECCGQEKVGNDGVMYVSRADKNGRCSWKKVN
jgi:hypothetical protein